MDLFVSAVNDSANDKTAGAAPRQRLTQGLQPFARDGNQQAAGRLRIETKVDQRFVHFWRNANRLADIFAVSLDGARDHALPEGFNRAVKSRQRIAENFRA